MKLNSDFRFTGMVFAVLVSVSCASALYFSSKSVEVVQAQPILPETMKMKLALTQELLQHLALKDFQQMSKVVADLDKLTEDAKWSKSTSPRYDMFAEDFRFRLMQLGDAADSGNIHGATLHYTSLIQTCVECHEIVRDGEILARSFDTRSLRPIGDLLITTD